jgi:hypothetical protein
VSVDRSVHRCVVIGLQSTGEAATGEMVQNDEVVDDFVSAPEIILRNLITKQVPLVVVCVSVFVPMSVCLCVHVY